MTERAALRIGALLFAVLYGVASFAPSLPEGADPDSRVLDLVNGSGRTAIVVGVHALAVAGLVFLCWVAVVVTRFDDGSPSWLPRAASAGGIGYGLILMVSSTFFGGIATGRSIGELPVTDDAFLVRAISNQGFHLLLTSGLICASLLVATVSTLGRRTGALPRWSVWTGWVVAVLLWAGAAWAPQFLVPLWAVMFSFALRPARPSQSVNASSRVSAAV